MLLVLDFESDIPIYTQICNQVMLGIAKGELLPDEPLPSVRQLASDLEINMHTVNKAYGILKNDGLVAIHKKKGVVIKKREDMKADESFSNSLLQRLEPVVAEAICKGVDEKRFLRLISTIFTSLKSGGQR